MGFELFQNIIQKIIKTSETLLDESKKTYDSAEQLLADYLDIPDQKNTWKNYSVKMLSRGFDISGRLDAEYYHPKYDTLFETLSKYTTVTQ